MAAWDQLSGEDHEMLCALRAPHGPVRDRWLAELTRLHPTLRRLPGHADSERLLEVHLFDFSGDLYGADLEIHFRRFIRAEQKFPSLDALKTQIAEDAASARA